MKLVLSSVKLEILEIISSGRNIGAISGLGEEDKKFDVEVGTACTQFDAAKKRRIANMKANRKFQRKD